MAYFYAILGLYHRGRFISGRGFELITPLNTPMLEGVIVFEMQNLKSFAICHPKSQRFLSAMTSSYRQRQFGVIICVLCDSNARVSIICKRQSIGLRLLE